MESSDQSFLLDSNRKRTESLSTRASFPLASRFSRESSHPPARDTEFGFSIIKPISLLVLSLQDNQFYLTQAARNYLNSLRGECYVISVSGNPLVGKSSLLNLLLSLFNRDASQENISYQEMYPIGDGKRSTTEGIDMYCLSINGKNFLFLDVEGDNDPNRKETGVWIYTNLIQTAVGASHIHINNYNGLPQESFLAYFESISKIVKQNNIHEAFETRYTFLRRNYSLKSKSMVAEEIEDFKEYFDERLSRGDLDYSLHLLPTPPQHITDRKSEASCLASTGFLCDNCKSDLFTTILLDLYYELNDHMNRMAPFKNGNYVANALEQLIEINRRELPFFLDGGHISKIRSNTFKKEQIRIQAGLLEVEQLQGSNSLYKEIQTIMSDHPNLADPQLYEFFNGIQMSLTTKISQMGFILPELSRFVEQYLLDDKASILDEKEKQALLETYVVHFERLTKDIITSLKEYDENTKAIRQTLVNIKTDTQTNLQEYVALASDSMRKTLAIFINIGASGLIGLLGKDMATKALAGVVAGGGVAGAALTAYFFMQAYKKLNDAKKKHEETLNKKKINGINNVQDAKEEMKKIGEFVTTLVKDLERNRETLNNVCSEEENGNFKLICTIKEVMDNKINGIRLSNNDRVRLIEGVRVAENNFQRFQNCL